MKVIALLLALCAMLFASLAEAGGVRVRGYTRKDGTYVAPHYRSAPNSSKLDNYSTRGNYNPYTGKTGTVDPYRIGWPTRSRTYIAPTYAAPSPTVMPSPQPSASSGWRNYGSPQSDYSNHAGIARESIGHGAAYAQPTDEEAALAAVQELGRRLRESDPEFDSKFAMIQPRIQEIQQSLPPKEWVSAILIAWPMLPPPTSAASMAVAVPRREYGRHECQIAADKARELADAANNLAKCASWGDLADDCSRQARAARYAADEYEDAVSSAAGVCY